MSISDQHPMKVCFDTLRTASAASWRVCMLEEYLLVHPYQLGSRLHRLCRRASPASLGAWTTFVRNSASASARSPAGPRDQIRRGVDVSHRFSSCQSRECNSRLDRATVSTEGQVISRPRNRLLLKSRRLPEPAACSPASGVLSDGVRNRETTRSPKAPTTNVPSWTGPDPPDIRRGAACRRSGPGPAARHGRRAPAESTAAPRGMRRMPR